MVRRLPKLVYTDAILADIERDLERFSQNSRVKFFEQGQ